jgi:hypothetical protein
MPLALTALGLMMLTGCQQAPPPAAAASVAPVAPAQAPPAPVTTSESTSSTRRVEVKSDASRPDVAAEKTVTKESTTVKQQQ